MIDLAFVQDGTQVAPVRCRFASGGVDFIIYKRPLAGGKFGLAFNEFPRYDIYYADGRVVDNQLSALNIAHLGEETVIPVAATAPPVKAGPVSMVEHTQTKAAMGLAPPHYDPKAWAKGVIALIEAVAQGVPPGRSAFAMPQEEQDALIKQGYLVQALAALDIAIATAEHARKEWDDAPASMKAGKILIALSEPKLNYQRDITQMHTFHANLRRFLYPDDGKKEGIHLSKEGG